MRHEVRLLAGELQADAPSNGRPPVQLLGAEGRSDEIRGARLAAFQTALVKASSEETCPRLLRLFAGLAE
ncbi:hypothetical protein [Streptomyces sp. NPDC057696]|uniref:hypothetical protein n=1 Tax=Streptomyces sp. NPDC057696 TaxID=3346218 RepID=UPI0036A4A671